MTSAVTKVTSKSFAFVRHRRAMKRGVLGKSTLMIWWCAKKVPGLVTGGMETLLMVALPDGLLLLL